MKFNKAMEALKRTQTAMKVELENTIVQLKNWKKSLIRRMIQAEDRISGLKDKIEDLDQISKEKEN